MTNLEKLRAATPEQIAEMFCYEYIENCDASLRFIFERYGGGKSGVLEWLNKEAIAPKDAPKDDRKDALKEAPKGWIKLKIVKGNIYVNASAIVGLKHAMNTVSGELTAVYTIGRDSPWHVYGSIDEIMGKIEKA